MMVPTCSGNSSLSCDDLVRPHHIDLNEDQRHGEDHPFTTPNHHQRDDEKGEKIIIPIISSGSSCSPTNIDLDGNSSVVKWMPSKKRMIRKMMMDQRPPSCSSSSSSCIAANLGKGKGNYVHHHNYYQDQQQQQQQQPLSPLITADRGSNNMSVGVRVCSDCHTTKTPLWRSGPSGPKSLCNACGIRQRKARRASAMAAAAANGTINVVAAAVNKVSASKIEKKKRKHLGSVVARKNKLVTFEDLTLRLSLSSSNFPQDDINQAAILLMALSYGLVHA